MYTQCPEASRAARPCPRHQHQRNLYPTLTLHLLPPVHHSAELPIDHSLKAVSTNLAESRVRVGVSKDNQKILGINPVNVGAFLVPFPPFGRKKSFLGKMWSKKRSSPLLGPKYLATSLEFKSHRLY